MNRFSGMTLYRVAIGFTLVFTCLHVIALPLGITYDGHEYLTMAQVLGTDRFPTDWQPIRTPLYPALLRIGFAICGTNPASVVAVTSGLGLIGVLALGHAVRHLAGPVAGAVALIVMVLDPLLISYQHVVLTESGVFGILGLVVGLLLWQPERAGMHWLKALGLGLLVAAGYYQRQNVIALAPVVALLHLAGAWGARQGTSAGDGSVAAGRHGSTRGAALAQAFVIATLPHLLALPWSPYVDNAGPRSFMLMQGVLRQALLPSDHPLIEPARQLYEQAIAEAWADDQLRSGLNTSALGAIAAKVGPAFGSNPEAQFIGFVWRYPGRYLAGVGRTMLAFTGFRSAQKANVAIERIVLWPHSDTGRNDIRDGPPRLDAAIRAQFTHPTSPGTLQHGLWPLRGTYRLLVIVAMLLLPVELIAGLKLRSLPLVTLAAIPLAYVGFYALILASE
jgi:hypothetical protein